MTTDTGMDPPPDYTDQLRSALDDLQGCVARYREKHDLHGDGSMAAGQAWDHMRRAEVRARALLKGSVPSPCIGCCSIHGSDTCRGCGRTIEEIQAWHGMDNDEKQAVLDRLGLEEGEVIHDQSSD